jgi:hypothetical protein
MGFLHSFFRFKPSLSPGAGELAQALAIPNSRYVSGYSEFVKRLAPLP